MIKILFVCHGNICRSPMAEFIMKEYVREAGLEKEFEIASAATSREELGNPVYPPARRELNRHGINCSGKYARQMTAAEYDRWDYIPIMDRNNERNIMRIIGSDPRHKVRRLMEYAGSNRDVADPWYTGDFEQTWDDLTEGCKALLNTIRKEYKI